MLSIFDIFYLIIICTCTTQVKEGHRRSRSASNKIATRCNFISGVLMLSIFDIFYLIIICIGTTQVKEDINVYPYLIFFI